MSPTTAGRIVDALLHELSDRSGFGDLLDNMHPQDDEEMRTTWDRIIMEHVHEEENDAAE